MDIFNDSKPMTFDWQPDNDLVKQIATRIALIDYSYDDELIGEFVSYWAGQPMRYHTTYQWTLKFTQSLKFKRTNFNRSETTTVGSQRVPKVAGLSTDSNTRNLVAQYGNNDNS